MIKGLSTQQAKQALDTYGLNELARTKHGSTLLLFIQQFTSPLILLLLGAAITSIAIGILPGQDPNTVDAVLIFVIVIISGILGFIQEYKAERSIEALQNMAAPKSTVIRDGKEQEVLSKYVVPGDIVLLEEGDIIPADGIVLENQSIQINEAPLTGESLPQSKKDEDPVYMNTHVLSGGATIKITETGMRSSMGKIASELGNMKEESTPFEQEMQSFSTKVVYFTLVLLVVITVVGLFKYPPYTAILLSISLAVAAIPEGLPAVVALTLTIGATAMSKKNALIRKLSVTESIGGVDLICTDKTGTITQNNMRVSHIVQESKEYNISKDVLPDMTELLLCSSLCTKVHSIGKRYAGDPTEIALVEYADRKGTDHRDLMKQYELIQEIPFSSERKMMSTIYKHDKTFTLYNKGAPEIVLEICTHELVQGKSKKLTAKGKEAIQQQIKKLASRGLRVLAFAQKEQKTKEMDENNLRWLGLIAMIDPPRQEVKDAILQCQKAGITVLMLTGDNPLTAKTIAEEVGLHTTDAITGNDIETMSDDDLLQKIQEGLHVFARVSPQHKLRVLTLLKKHHRVAMTGDGVNDALALKKADVGVSMGIRGTEVAKQASDIMLLDDNFATIVDAVREGRRIFGNIRKFINYLFITNLAEVLVIFIGTATFTTTTPVILPAQLLWINLLTDGLPAIALGADPAPKDIMKQPVRKRNEPIINKQLGWLIALIGLKKTIVLLAVYLIALPWGEDIARTMLFTGFVLLEFARIGSIRRREQLTFFSNPLLVWAVGISVLLQIVLLYSPLAPFFGVAFLGVREWIVLITATILAYFTALWITDMVTKYVKN